MRRIILGFFSIIIIFGVIWGEDIEIKGKILGITLKSQDEIDAICEEKEFLGFDTNILLDDCPLGYDENQNILLIPQELEKENFHGELEAEEGELFFLADDMWENKGNAIAENHVFRLFRVADEKYWMYNVYFTGIPVAKLTTEIVDENGESNGTMWVYNQYSQSNKYQEGRCRFRLRGASSMAFPKSSYKVTFTEKDYSLLGMREDDDWILNSLYDDEGLIHNKVSYELWQQIARSNSVSYDEGISMEYVEIFVDNEYKGVYGLLERVDKKALNLNEKDILYKGVGTRDVGEDDFYLELKEGMNPMFELKYPAEFEANHWEPLREYINGLNHCQYTNFEEAVEKINMENFIDYTLFNLFLAGEDNLQKNIYYWADYQADGSYKMIKVPWDLNMTWGNGWYEEHAYHFNLYQSKYIEEPCGWTDDMIYLYQLNPLEIGNLMYTRWKELRQDIITTNNLFAILEQQIAYVNSSGAYLRDSMFWGNREEYWNNQYIYDYAEGKIEMMDRYLEELSQGKIHLD